MSVQITSSQFQHKFKCSRCGSTSYENNLEYQEQGKCSSCINLTETEAKKKKKVNVMVFRRGTRNFGFFSNCSVLLFDLYNKYNKFKYLPKNIDFKKTFNNYKTDEQILNKKNTYPLFFKINKNIKIEKRSNYIIKEDYNLNKEYKPKDIYIFKDFVSRYFDVSNEIKAIQKDFIKKYIIDLEKTICIWYRGTDKYKESHSASLNSYIIKLKEIIKTNSSMRVWIQTDQHMALEHFKKKLKNIKHFNIKESITTQGNEGIHLGYKGNGFELGKIHLAITHLISQCHTIITHSGNGSFWAYLYRGNLDNFYQDKLFKYDPWK